MTVRFPARAWAMISCGVMDFTASCVWSCWYRGRPYLDTYSHVTAIEAGTLAFTHIHPQNPVNGDHGGPELRVEAAFPAPGEWRLFIQFQTAGTLHTAEMTVHV